MSYYLESLVKQAMIGMPWLSAVEIQQRVEQLRDEFAPSYDFADIIECLAQLEESDWCASNHYGTQWRQIVRRAVVNRPIPHRARTTSHGESSDGRQGMSEHHFAPCKGLYENFFQQVCGTFRRSVFK